MRRSMLLIISLLLTISNTIFAAQVIESDITKEFIRAQNLVAQGKQQQAISAYQSIINTHPQIPEAYNNLAALYLEQKNIQQAKAILEQGLKAHKGYARLYESLTSINIAMARDAYSQALQIDLKPSSVTIASLSLPDMQPEKFEHPSRELYVNSKQEEVTTQVADVAINMEKPGDARINNSDSIKQVLQAWSAAWSAQSVDMYLSFYHDKYEPAKGLSRKTWEKSRRLRLKKPDWIKVGLSDFNVTKNTGKQAVVNFKQLYQSNTFRDVSLKQMVLLYTNNGWQILREKSL